MKLCIPTVGDSIILLSDWTVDLFNEARNATLMNFFNDNRFIENEWSNPPIPSTVVQYVIPAGERLKIDRIYIRKNQGDFDSITFLWTGKSIPAHIETVPGINWGPGAQTPDRQYKVPKKPVRFWVKLDCANEIEFDWAP